MISLPASQRSPNQLVDDRTSAEQGGLRGSAGSSKSPSAVRRASVETGRGAELIAREFAAVCEVHGAVLFSRPDRLEALKHDLAAMIAGATPRAIEVELELLDDRNSRVAACYGRANEAAVRIVREQDLAAAAATRYRLSVGGVSAKQLSLLAPKFRLRWRRPANRQPAADAGPRVPPAPPKAGASPVVNQSARPAPRLTLRVNNSGCRGYGFADALDGSWRNVFCHLNEAPAGFRFQIGDLITARIVTTDQGVQAREIQAASARCRQRPRTAA